MKKKEHKYLLYLHGRVNDYLTGNPDDKENLPDIIVSFCTVVEKILKIKLHRKNPVLIFDAGKLQDDNALATVVKKKEKDIKTAKIAGILARVKIIFSRIFSEEELQILTDVYNIRNEFNHSYKSDDEILLDPEDVVKKMGTLWGKISKQAVSLFGKDNVKTGIPKRKYSEEELEQVLIEEVRTKIKAMGETGNFIYPRKWLTYNVDTASYYPRGNKCPRCGSYGFSSDESDSYATNVFSPTVHFGGVSFPDLYKCKDCHLELTSKEYEIAKKLKSNL
ncbi:MAG: hypothetical protein AAB364_02235 [Patescibacteria group bacterium]